jgi:uncharacterized protein
LHPQPSNIAKASDAGRQDGPVPAPPPPPRHQYHWKIVWKRRLATASRWLHIYLSMVSFAVVLFFSVTGLTLNHTEWFAKQQRTVQKKGSVDLKWLKPEVDKLQVVEHLRSTDGIKGAVAELRTDDSQVSVSFKGPGYSADAFIDRDSGKYDLTENRMGIAAILNDLHKGRDSGKGWGWVIDISAVLLTFISFTGLLILFFLAKRRVSGLVALAVGGLICYLAYLIFVP